MRYARYLVFLLALPAMAKTPDGKPPSVEDVCDEYKGAAYGQCNAYCEARDCDDPRVRASDRSCEVTRAKFKKLTGDEMPCDAHAGCTVDAADDDIFDMSASILTNDKTTGKTALTVESYTAPSDVTVNVDGTFKISWPDSETTYERTVDYEICCDGTSTCDTARALIRFPGA